MESIDRPERGLGEQPGGAEAGHDLGGRAAAQAEPARRLGPGDARRAMGAPEQFERAVTGRAVHG